jgi:type VI secretion system protein ImpG
MFVDVEGLRPALKRHNGAELEIVLLFSRGEAALENLVDAGNFSLFCAPAINLFPKRADRIHLTDNTFDYHVVGDRTRPMDFEIFDVTSVVGYGVGSDSNKPSAFYADFHTEHREHHAYFTLQREPRLLGRAEAHRLAFQLRRQRSVPVGSIPSALFERSAPTLHHHLCTNRDLPLTMPLNLGKTDFTLESAAPVEGIRCAKGPSKPYSRLWEGAIAWRLISHLSLNYLSLTNANDREGAAALREMLELYATSTDAGLKKQIEGVHSVRVQPITRRLPLYGPISFGRGLEIELLLDEMAFQGGSSFLFASVLEQFFARYVSINSFTETVLRSTARGEVMRWVPRCGERPIL